MKTEEEIKELERLNELYLNNSFQLLELIFKLQAKDITEEYLFKTIKEIVRPDIYNNMYHRIVAKDYLGATFILPADDVDAEDDTDTLVIINKE